MSREVPFQDKLRDLLKDVAKKYRFNDLEIAEVEREYPVGGKRADIVVFCRGGAPFLIIETKKKVEKPGLWKIRDMFQPIDPAAVGQAMSYVALYGKQYGSLPPFFAIATRSSIAVFRTPKRLDDYVNFEKAEEGEYGDVIKPGMYVKLVKKYLIKKERLEFTEEYIYKLLDTLAQAYLKRKFVKIEPTWTLIGYFRDFVNDLAHACEDLLEGKMKRDPLKAKLDAVEKETGYRPDSARLAKMMAYVLMNKVIFHRILEGRYRLRKMAALDTSSSNEFMRQLNRYFDEAIKETGDFEPVFKTGIYDMLSIPDDPHVMEYINDFITTLDSIRVIEIGNLVGYIYEELIPHEERHRLGQFYTPPAICELITKWAVTHENDSILDPGAGSGGFLLWAYKCLLKLKTGRDALPAPRGVHERILRQLYAIDINPFANHLTAINLAMRNVRAPSTEMNVVEDDFFNAEPGKHYPAIVTAKGELTRTIAIPVSLDVVIGNPPYTRWTEIPQKTQDRILELLRSEIKSYGLTPQIRRGVEPGIYVYWIMHATKFLKNRGRLGMIISDSWLQADYGVNFGNFLLDHYKIHAIIDISARMFRVPLIGTCIVLLEKCSEKEERDNNKATYMFLDVKGERVNADDVLRAVEEAKARGTLAKGEIGGATYIACTYEQRELARKREKWIKFVFPLGEIQRRISEKTVKLSQYFEPSYGNIRYVYLASRGDVHGVRNVGGESFFYIGMKDVADYNLPEKYLHPLLPSSKYARFFTFADEDWKKLRDEGVECFLFVAHEPRGELPESVKNYIRLGELDQEGIGLRRRPSEKFKPVCKSLASITREKYGEHFFGWYDLGGVIKAPIFAAYGVQYWVRFILPRINVALDSRVLALVPKQDIIFNEEELKALLAYLNSSLTQIQVEAEGRTTGGGMVELDVKPLSELMIPDVKNLPRKAVERLARLFDKLEKSARELGGADKFENIFSGEIAKKLIGSSAKGEVVGLWNTVIKEIDYAVADVLGIERSLVDDIRSLTLELIARRLSRAEEARPEVIRGEEEPRIEPPKKVKRAKKGKGQH